MKLWVDDTGCLHSCRTLYITCNHHNNDNKLSLFIAYKYLFYRLGGYMNLLPHFIILWYFVNLCKRCVDTFWQRMTCERKLINQVVSIYIQTKIYSVAAVILLDWTYTFVIFKTCKLHIRIAGVTLFAN